MAVRDGKFARVRGISSAGWLLATILLCTLSAHAQVEIGDNINLNLNGTLGYGYGAAFGNAGSGSSHSSGLNGSAELSGYYFHPNFLSFDIRPYYQRSQSNSDSQVIDTGSGFTATASFFGGSRFPGSISYSRDFSSNHQFQFAGAPSVSGDSSGQGLTIGWSALLPNLPQLQATFSSGTSTSTIAGLNGDNTSSTKNFNLTSNYQLRGWGLAATYNISNSSFDSASILLGDRITSSGTSSGYSFTASHAIPLSGSFSAGLSGGNYGSGVGGDSSSMGYSLGAGITPFRRLSLFSTAQYTTNVFASMSQSLLNGTVTDMRTVRDAQGLYWSSSATLTILKGLTANGRYSFRDYQVAGLEFRDSQIGASINYNFAHRLFGLLYFGLGVLDSATKEGNTGAGMTANVGMDRRFGRWDTSADFNYSQNMMTIGSIVNTSSYTYGGNIRRKIDADTYWSGSFRASHSGLVQQSGTGNAAEYVSSTLTWRKYNVFGNYSESRGTAVINSAGGLTATPVGSLLTDDFLLFNAHGFSAGLGTNIKRHISLSGSYSRFRSESNRATSGTWSVGDRYSFRAQYKVRKFQFLGVFNRSEQEVSSITGGPRVINSFSLSLSRWFNVF